MEFKLENATKRFVVNSDAVHRHRRHSSATNLYCVSRKLLRRVNYTECVTGKGKQS